MAIVAVHAVYLVGWAGWLEWGRATATTIRLDLVQRDPRDLLRGDYITLAFDISTIPPTMLGGARPGDRVWVVLAPGGDAWHAIAAATRPVAVAPGQRLIVGTVGWANPLRGINVAYGIERYYVPEGRGTPPRGRIQADVALARDGRAQVVGVLVDGRPYP